MFNFLSRGKKKQGPRPPRAPGETVRAHDLADLQQWAADRVLVEGFIEPETLVNELSVVLVDATGEFIRRPIGGPKGIDVIAKELGVDLYDVEETGYPQRMRDRIERERLLRKRQEQAQRRKQWEQRNSTGESS
ncbi:oxidoreductase [Corynebacterium aquilae]|uniref:Oxidoreductase n=1 Tax=Corynebacterium aquilae DSM 44791 TaxID=1431546 RepID=A0A1L7CH27_9CORY|nr:oxidoreductase [Corynebacterium aquilae]APT85134.1 oxidoreductase [Corynebacterium aquilae DSM 44791]